MLKVQPIHDAATVGRSRQRRSRHLTLLVGAGASLTAATSGRGSISFAVGALTRPLQSSPSLAGVPSATSLSGSSSTCGHCGKTGRREGRSQLPRYGLPEVFSSVQGLLDTMPQQVEALGPLGPLYFFGVYVLAECVALPATPLTLSAGYLFGLPLGCALALSAGTTAACIGFFLSRTFLRPQIEKLMSENETLTNINKAVEREGFKIIFLLRLSPLLPFALSNYVYGLSNVNFVDFAVATALGFAPGTCAFVYLATTARSVMNEGASEPWYVYASGVLVTVFLLKVVSDVAKKAVDESIEADKREAAELATMKASNEKAKIDAEPVSA